ncbi:MAG: response regulator, partial [Chloroflexota bacterium]
SQVDDVSGRGVGLDAVREAIERVRGAVEVVSELGQGTTFSLRFPVTLAQARVVMAEVAGSPVAVAASSVRRVARLRHLETERFGDESIARLDGHAYPIADLAATLGLAHEAPLPENPPVLFVESGGQRAAFVAGAVGTHQEVVVKSTGSHLRTLRGVAGATMLQDGRVALLLHLPDVLGRALAPVAPPMPGRHAVQAPAGSLVAGDAPIGGTRPAGGGTLKVLVVDDSPTIRKLVVRTLQDLGWTAAEAKDGAEALESIRTNRPDVVISDVEMPRLDGYGLLAALRSRPETAALPVIMLTSRTAERHRHRAVELGANGYLTKPYRPADVVAALRGVVQGAEAAA